MDKKVKLEEIVEAIKSIEIILEDNNQNLKDCKRELRELKKALIPQKPSWLKRVLKQLNI